MHRINERDRSKVPRNGASKADHNKDLFTWRHAKLIHPASSAGDSVKSPHLRVGHFLLIAALATLPYVEAARLAASRGASGCQSAMRSDATNLGMERRRGESLGLSAVSQHTLLKSI